MTASDQVALAHGIATGINSGLRATPLPISGAVSGTVAVSNLPATQPVSGTVSVGNFPATQPVSGTVAVSALPAPTVYSITNTFTVTGVTSAVDMSAAPAKFFSIQAVGQGGVPGAWTVTLEVGLESGSWSTLLTHNLALGNLIVLPNTLPTLAAFMRLNCSALTLGIGPTGLKVIVKAVP